MIKLYAGIDDFARWDICYYCDKPKEDTLIYFNHYDGKIKRMSFI